MFLTRLRLTSFRNFKVLQKDFSKKRVLIIGPNGAGKSSLLEAISLLGFGSSLRAWQDKELILQGQKKGLVRGELTALSKVRHHLTVELELNQKTLSVDGKTTALVDFVGFVPLVSFSPEDLSLLSGSPRKRRQFLDRFLSLLDVTYLTFLTDYKKVLRNRNRLLASPGSNLVELEYWNDRFADLAAKLLLRRFEVLRKINTALKKEPGKLEIGYLPSPRTVSGLFRSADRAQCQQLIQQEIAAKLKHLAGREQELGFSLIGPQRDDFRLFLADRNNMDVGVFGSRGEQRLAIVNLKRVQLDLLGSHTSEKPILLLDDVFSELDRVNQTALFSFLTDHQVFITATSILPVLKKRLGDFQVVELPVSTA